MNNKKKAAKGTGTLNIQGWPRGLQRRMKVVAAEQGLTVKEAMMEAVEEYLKRRNKLK